MGKQKGCHEQAKGIYADRITRCDRNHSPADGDIDAGTAKGAKPGEDGSLSVKSETMGYGMVDVH